MGRAVFLPRDGRSCAAFDAAEQQHELSAALFGLEASAEGLSRRLEADRDLRELATAMMLEVRRVRRMLDGARPANVTFELAGAIAAVMTTARATGQSLISVVPPALAVVGDPSDAAQVLLGLLDNARRHAPGSTVVVSVAVDATSVALLVEDSGPGVMDDGEIFDRGVRGPTSDGRGLGLSIARRLMERHGGTLTTGQGSHGGASFIATFRRA